MGPVRPDPLRAALRDAADPDGTLPFDRFMETVLYHEAHGYFAARPDRAGTRGDFVTSPELTPLFAACVADWVTRLHDAARDAEFHLVEVGAGRGTLARALLDALDANAAGAIQYHAVERAPAPRQALQDALGPDIRQGRVEVHADVSDLPRGLTNGAFLANELFDNLPVRRVLQTDTLHEIRVRLQGRRIHEVLAPAPPDLVALVRDHGLRLAPGQAAEVCPTGVPLLEAVLGRFRRGGVLLFDYGGTADEVAGEAAPHGTLAAHRQHAVTPDLYAHLGDQDLTANVNFTPLVAAARRLGYEDAALQDQAQFLVAHGLPERLVALAGAAPDDLERLRVTQLAKLVYHPEAMGGSFRAMVGQKT